MELEPRCDLDHLGPLKRQLVALHSDGRIKKLFDPLRPPEPVTEFPIHDTERSRVFVSAGDESLVIEPAVNEERGLALSYSFRTGSNIVTWTDNKRGLMRVRTGVLKGCVTSTLKVKAMLPAVDPVTDKTVSIKP